jgi:hypothetical protein
MKTGVVITVILTVIVFVPALCDAQSRREQSAAILAKVDSTANWTNRHPLPNGPVMIVIHGRPEDGPFGPLKDLPPTTPLSNGSYSYGPSYVLIAPSAPSWRASPGGRTSGGRH